MGKYKIKVALIIDDYQIPKWQLMALEEVEDLIDISLILNCANTRTKKHIFKHFLYYVLNILCYRNQLTKKSKYPLNKEQLLINFKTKYKGIWQIIPNKIVEVLEKENITLVLKMGMGLLKTDNLHSYDILSFHHGDPNHYRGRPAGFYENYFYEEKQGIIVQKISNKLDGGDVYDLSHLKIFHHSLSKSVQYFYQESPKVLRKAILNYLSKKTIKYNNGKVYKLPPNNLVILFFAKLLYRKFKRIVYGLFFEKKWNILQLKNQNVKTFNNFTIDRKSIPKIHKDYTFYADPFYFDNDTLFVEAMNKFTGLGEIVKLSSKNYKFLGKILTRNIFRIL